MLSRILKNAFLTFEECFPGFWRMLSTFWEMLSRLLKTTFSAFEEWFLEFQKMFSWLLTNACSTSYEYKTPDSGVQVFGIWSLGPQNLEYAGLQNLGFTDPWIWNLDSESRSPDFLKCKKLRSEGFKRIALFETVRKRNPEVGFQNWLQNFQKSFLWFHLK